MYEFRAVARKSWSESQIANQEPIFQSTRRPLPCFSSVLIAGLGGPQVSHVLQQCSRMTRYVRVGLTKIIIMHYYKLNSFGAVKSSS